MRSAYPRGIREKRKKDRGIWTIRTSYVSLRAIVIRRRIPSSPRPPAAAALGREVSNAHGGTLGASAVSPSSSASLLPNDNDTLVITILSRAYSPSK
jgi:hypothetical protein